MTKITYTDDTLNLFIDEQLDRDEMDRLHQHLLSDQKLRERVCQLKAVRNLVGYAYENVPVPDHFDQMPSSGFNKTSFRAIAASLIMGLGLMIGWGVHEYQVNSPEHIFSYYKDELAPKTEDERRIVLHLTTSDVKAVNAALSEAEALLASYRNTGTPMKLDIVTNKDAVNVFREDMSPYKTRLHKMMTENENLTFFACRRTIEKLMKKEGKMPAFMPKVVIDETAAEIIPDRIKRGWVYIRA